MRNLSLFTGSGIGDLAALRAGITTVAQCENDPVCQFALRKLWPDCYLFEDVTLLLEGEDYGWEIEEID